MAEVVLKRVFTALVLYQHNMRLIHWNCCGSHFDNIHKISMEYANKMEEQIDEVAEIMMMVTNTKPLSLKEVFDFAENDTDSYEFFNTSHDSGKEVFEIMGYMMNHLILLYNNACKSDLPADVVGKLQEHQYYYRLESDYKNKRRLMKS